MDVEIFVVEVWDDVEMDVEDCLFGGGVVELGDLYVVWLYFFDQGVGQVLDYGYDFGQVLCIDFEQVVCFGVFGNYQGMFVGLWEQIEEGEYVFVFVDFVVGSFVVNDFGEDVLGIVNVVQIYGGFF